MAQLAARRSHNPKVASSILAGSITFFYFLGVGLGLARPGFYNRECFRLDGRAV